MGKLGFGYGSEWHLLRYLGRHRNLLGETIINNIGHGTSIDWLDFAMNPAKDCFDEEIEGLDFLNDTSLLTEWNRFWPRTGSQQNWDAVGWLNSDSGKELLLVEAKAHLAEILSHCQAKPASQRGGRDIIEKALNQVKGSLGAAPSSDWLSPYYQYANRLAVLWFLRQQGIQARLVGIYFTDPKSTQIKVQCPKHESAWLMDLNKMETALGLPAAHPLHDYIHKVFLPVC